MTSAPAPQAPPYCPNPQCRHHFGADATWRYERIGTFSRQEPPRTVQRFRCRTCNKSFSEQTFRTTYWLKRPKLQPLIFRQLQACSAYRQIARNLGCAPSTVAVQAARLGRHSLLFHQLHRPKGLITEELSMDSFEGFEWSQFHPSSYHVAVGRGSHFFHGFTATELRRKGAMTKEQKKMRSEIEERFGRPDPKGVEKDFAELIRIVVAKAQPLVLHTDEHKAYPRALRRVNYGEIEHRTISSRAARTPGNPLFPVNLLDLLIRHSGSLHKRETIAFPKRLQSGCWRMAGFMVWRNWIKPFSERAKRDEKATPAMRLGLIDHALTVEDVLAVRLVPSRVKLPAAWKAYYWGMVRTRMIPNCQVHEKRYAV